MGRSRKGAAAAVAAPVEKPKEKQCFVPTNWLAAAAKLLRVAGERNGDVLSGVVTAECDGARLTLTNSNGVDCNAAVTTTTGDDCAPFVVSFPVKNLPSTRKGMTMAAIRADRSDRVRSARGLWDSELRPAADAGRGVRVGGAELRGAIEYALRAASLDTARPHLCGVRLEREGDGLLAVATDGHRLHVGRCAAEFDDDIWVNVFLSSSAAGAIVAALSDELVSAVSVQVFADGSVVVSAAGLRLSVTAAPDATEVGWRHTVPVWRTAGAYVAMDGVSAWALSKRVRAASHAFVMRVGGENGASLMAWSLSDEWKPTEELPIARAEGCGSRTPVGFNARYIDDALRVPKGAPVWAALSGELDPVLIVSPGRQAVVMPMRVR